MKTVSNRAEKSVLSRAQCLLEHIRTLARSHNFFLEMLVHQIAHSWDNRGFTEIRPVVPIIDGISAFRVPRSHQRTTLHYSPAPCVCPICSGIFRYRDSAQKSPQSAESRKPFSSSRHGPIGSQNK